MRRRGIDKRNLTRYNKFMDKAKMLELRLDGRSYQYIANEAGITRQRVQQILSPPASIRNFVVAKFNGRCNRCGIFVGASGHVHHNGDLAIENYDDPNNLELLCLVCHRKAHWGEKPGGINANLVRKSLGLTQDAFAAKLGVTPMTVKRWEKGTTKPSRMARKLLEEIAKGVEK